MIIKWIKSWFENKHPYGPDTVFECKVPMPKVKPCKDDPARSCAVYKEIGCTHVDGYLCDFPHCEILKKCEESK